MIRYDIAQSLQAKKTQSILIKGLNQIAIRNRLAALKIQGVDFTVSPVLYEVDFQVLSDGLIDKYIKTSNPIKTQPHSRKSSYDPSEFFSQET
jgi:hypothetical protein